MRISSIELLSVIYSKTMYCGVIKSNANPSYKKKRLCNKNTKVLFKSVVYTDSFDALKRFESTGVTIWS